MSDLEEEDNREMEDMELEEQEDEDEEFLLLMAVLDRDLPKMRDVLERYPNIDVNHDDSAALRSAVKRNFFEGARLLLENGADVRADDDVCLTDAIENDYLEMVRLLIHYGANIHVDGDYPILAAARKGSPEIVRLLMAEGSEDLETALDTAIVNNHVGVVRVLIEGVINMEGDVARADLHYNNEQPLQDAIRMNNAEIVQLLLSFGADVEHPYVRNSINTAAALGHNELVELIQRNNAAAPAVQQPRTNRIQRAREQEAKNEELRAMAIQEQKISESKKETWVQNQCTNEMTLYGDEIEEKDRDKIVVIFLGSENGNPAKGECLTAEELIRIKEEEKVGIWEGPPSGTVLGEYAPGRRKENAFVFKLPWTGIWVTKEVLEEALKNINGFIVLKNKRLESLGSSFGSSQLHGQWGGKWGYEELVDNNGIPYQKVKFFPEGGFQPDERFEVWSL